MAERTLILIKPDGVQRALIGKIIDRYEKRGLRIVGMKMLRVPRDLAEAHYDVHRDMRTQRDGLLLARPPREDPGADLLHPLLAERLPLDR